MNTNTQENVKDTTFLSPERMACTLLDTLGQYSDKDVPAHVRVWSPRRDSSLLFESEDLLGLSLEDIARLLRSLYETA